MNIRIDVKEKRASLVERATIICGNTDYKAVFAFDEEWAEHKFKTARFIVNGEPIDVVFEGNTCDMPKIINATGVYVGVYAGDLQTTTPAYINCDKSILCSGGTPKEPTPDVYAQLMQKINDGTIKGEKGEQGEKGEKGEKGDAGAIKFLSVVSLPTENIETDAIYLVPVADSTAEENRFTEYAYIDGKWETLGAISVQVDHSEYVKFTDIAKGSTKAGVVKMADSFQAVTNTGGIFYGTVTGLPTIRRATNEFIDKRTPTDYIDAGARVANVVFPICPANLDYAVKAVLTDSKLEWTEEEKAKARALLGIE